MVDSVAFVDKIKREARKNNQRTGQYLFNYLPEGAANVVASTLFDPFHKELTWTEILEWIESHLIFKGEEIVGVFNNNDVLWESVS